MRASTTARSIAVTAVAAAATFPAAANATWAGSTGRIAWTGVGGLHSARPDGSGDRVLYRNARDGIQWSPDGRRLVFVGDRGIMRMRADGSHRHVIVPRDYLGDDLLLEPAWAPGGKRIVFSSEREVVDYDAESVQESWRVYVVSRDGKNIRKVTHGHHAVWSRDGRYLLYAEEDGDIARIKPNGKRHRVLAHGKGYTTGLDLSPNGRRLVWRTAGKVRTLNLRTHRRTSFPTRYGTEINAFDLAWTPNGRRLAFVHWTGTPVDEIRTVRPNGKGVKTLFRLPEGLTDSLAWQTH